MKFLFTIFTMFCMLSVRAEIKSNDIIWIPISHEDLKILESNPTIEIIDEATFSSIDVNAQMPKSKLNLATLKLKEFLGIKRVDSQGVATILAALTGTFGIHRFFLKHTVAGCVYLGTFAVMYSMFLATGRYIFLPLTFTPTLLGLVDAVFIFQADHDFYEENYHHNKDILLWMSSMGK